MGQARRCYGTCRATCIGGARPPRTPKTVNGPVHPGIIGIIRHLRYLTLSHRVNGVKWYG
jgi:hypothetical protein